MLSYNAVIIVTDANGNSATNTVKFDTLSPAETVRTYVRNICQKMHVRGRLEAVAKHRME